MSDAIINAAFGGLFLLGTGTTLFFLALMCIDEFGEKK